MLEVTQSQVAGLHLGNPFGNGLFAARRTDDWEGIDEQADVFFHPWQIRRTPSHSGAKANGRLTGIALQQQQPG